jgi:hypothetical protein
MKINRKHLVVLQLLFLLGCADTTNIATDLPDKIPAALKAGQLVPRVTDVSEFKAMFGAPIKEETSPDGGGTVTRLLYSDRTFIVFKQQNKDSANTLAFISIGGHGVDLGKPVLRSTSDLLKLDKFWGLQNVSLAKLDLSGESKLLSDLPFDSNTQWPPQRMLPKGFNPQKILGDGKDPGLGIRALHAKGINGKNVGIAIIDQPLLLDHREYSARIAYSKAIDVSGISPLMHGPSVASFAVGRDIGTAPEASLYYFAVPSWKGDNTDYADALQTIIEINATKPLAEKIRVVSISAGAFRRWKNYDIWKKTLAAAQTAGILVITCDESFMDFGNLTRSPAKNPDLADNYMPEIWDHDEHKLWVPGGNRTRASHTGANDYVFDVVGGRSWATPYLAGVVALGYQVNPTLTPTEIKELLLKSATQTKYGPVINPGGFAKLAAGLMKK